MHGRNVSHAAGDGSRASSKLAKASGMTPKDISVMQSDLSRWFRFVTDRQYTLEQADQSFEQTWEHGDGNFGSDTEATAQRRAIAQAFWAPLRQTMTPGVIRSPAKAGSLRIEPIPVPKASVVHEPSAPPAKPKGTIAPKSPIAGPPAKATAKTTAKAQAPAPKSPNTGEYADVGTPSDLVDGSSSEEENWGKWRPDHPGPTFAVAPKERPVVAKMVASFESKATATRRTTEAKQAGLQQMAADAEEQRRQNQVKAMAAQAPWQTGASGSSDIASAPWRQEENREAQQRDPRTNRERRHKKPLGPYQPQQPRVLVAPKGSVTGSVASYVPVPPPPVPPPPSQAGPSSSSAGSGPLTSHGGM